MWGPCPGEGAQRAELRQRGPSHWPHAGPAVLSPQGPLLSWMLSPEITTPLPGSGFARTLPCLEPGCSAGDLLLGESPVLSLVTGSHARRLSQLRGCTCQSWRALWVWGGGGGRGTGHWRGGWEAEGPMDFTLVLM